MRIYAVLNQKGGVGKTTLAVNLAAGLARRNKKILLLDLDPQAHLTYCLGLETPGPDQTVHGLLRGAAALGEVTQQKGKLRIVPASLSLSGVEVEFASQPGREVLLKEALAQAGEYEFVLMDCPPNLGLMTVMALTAAHGVLIPLQAEFLSLQSLSRLMETVRVVKKRLNPALEIAGIIVSRFVRRKRLSREVTDKLTEYFADKLYATAIRDNVSLAEAPSFGLDIFSYKPKSNGAKDFSALCREFLKRETE